MDVDITIQCALWPENLCQQAEKAILFTLAQAGFETDGEISLVFADDHFVRVLNKNYRGKDKPTNVLSFPQMEAGDLAEEESFVALGDVILAYQTIEREAREQNKTLADHTLHMIIHGTLHLLGYDHIEDNEAEEMEALEIRILSQMGIKNPYESAEDMA